MEKTQRLYVAVMLFAVAMFLGGCGHKSQVVHISSEPTGAKVSLNDKALGTTPLDTQVEQRAGDFNVYTFRAEKEDYMPMLKVFKEQKFQQTVGELFPPTLHFALVERKKYDIRITSAPSGAKVTLNGQVIGETPFTATVRERIDKPRVLEFVAVKEGYKKGQTVLKEFLPKEDGTVFVFPESLHFELIQ